MQRTFRTITTLLLLTLLSGCLAPSFLPMAQDNHTGCRTLKISGDTVVSKECFVPTAQQYCVNTGQRDVLRYAGEFNSIVCATHPSAEIALAN